MTDHTPDSPRVLKCSGTADFLAALPQLAGFTASDSLFVLFFDGSRTREAMRVDLPPNDDPREATDLLEFLSHTIRTLGAEMGCSSPPAIAIMSELTFAECQGPPWLRLARRIERRLRRDRIYPRELCVRAPDAWVSYLDPTAPLRGRSLEEIELSPIAVEARQARQEVPSLANLGALPAPDPDRLARAARSLAELDAGAAAAARDLGDRAATRARVALVPEVTRELCSATGAFSPECAGRLAHVLAEPGSWWHVAMGVITRPEFPGELEREFGPLAHGRLPVDDPEPTGGRQIVYGCSMRSLFASVCPEFTERERISPLRSRLARALADAPEAARPGLFALSALVWWLCGNQTTANNQVDAALEVDPAHEISLMVRRLVAVSVVAQRRGLPLPQLSGRESRLPRAAVS